MKRRVTALLLCAAMLSTLLLTGATPQSTSAPVLQDGGTSGDKGVILKKTAAYQGEDIWNISLEAYVTGQRVTVEQALPTDLVLVLDQSGSMGDAMAVTTERQYEAVTQLLYFPFAQQYYVKVGNAYVEAQWGDSGKTIQIPFVGEISVYDWFYYNAEGEKQTISPKRNSVIGKDQLYVMTVTSTQKTRTQVLKDQVSAFLDQVAATGVEHRVAIAGFASESGHGDNTELFRGAQSVRYGSLTAADYAGAFQDASTSQGLTALKASVEQLAYEGATRVDLGMNMAQQIFANNPVEAGKRSRAVIVFTDGVPTSASEFDMNVANAALSAAHTIKGTYGAKVYAIGVMDQADPQDLTRNVNCFLNGLSSNYPDATQMNALGTRVSEEQQFYFAAQESKKLGEIFTSISQSIGGAANTVLNRETIVKDVLSDYFALPQGFTPQSVAITTAACIGDNTWGQPTTAPGGVTASVQDNGIQVTGFDFSENWCGQDNGVYRGSKLCITFPICRKAGFIGGSAVPSNQAASGIYLKDTPVEGFYEPHVDVPLAYSVDARDQTVYLGQNADLNQDLLLGAQRLNGVNNAFVTVKYTLTDTKTNAVAATWTLPAGSNTEKSDCPQIQWASGYPAGVTTPQESRPYTIACEVSARQETLNTRANFHVYVKTCTLTITKSGGATEDSYLFRVTSGEGAGYLVAVQGNGTVTLGKLPIGTYTVTEDASWSWRYGADAVIVQLKPGAESDHGTVTILNRCVNRQWLSGESAAVNRFFRAPVAQ